MSADKIHNETKICETTTQVVIKSLPKLKDGYEWMITPIQCEKFELSIWNKHDKIKSLWYKKEFSPRSKRWTTENLNCKIFTNNWQLKTLSQYWKDVKFRKGENPFIEEEEFCIVTEYLYAIDKNGEISKDGKIKLFTSRKEAEDAASKIMHTMSSPVQLMAIPLKTFNLLNHEITIKTQWKKEEFYDYLSETRKNSLIEWWEKNYGENANNANNEKEQKSEKDFEVGRVYSFEDLMEFSDSSIRNGVFIEDPGRHISVFDRGIKVFLYSTSEELANTYGYKLRVKKKSENNYYTLIFVIVRKGH